MNGKFVDFLFCRTENVLILPNCLASQVGRDGKMARQSSASYSNYKLVLDHSALMN
jgi:hypothetical protein